MDHDRKPQEPTDRRIHVFNSLDTQTVTWPPVFFACVVAGHGRWEANRRFVCAPGDCRVQWAEGEGAGNEPVPYIFRERSCFT